MWHVRTTITWPVQSVNIVMEKRNVKAFDQNEQHNETAIPLLLSFGMTHGRFHHCNFANRRSLMSLWHV